MDNLIKEIEYAKNDYENFRDKKYGQKYRKKILALTNYLQDLRADILEEYRYNKFPEKEEVKVNKIDPRATEGVNGYAGETSPKNSPERSPSSPMSMTTSRRNSPEKSPRKSKTEDNNVPRVGRFPGEKIPEKNLATSVTQHKVVEKVPEKKKKKTKKEEIMDDISELQKMVTGGYKPSKEEIEKYHEQHIQDEALREEEKKKRDCIMREKDNEWNDMMENSLKPKKKKVLQKIRRLGVGTESSQQKIIR